MLSNIFGEERNIISEEERAVVEADKGKSGEVPEEEG